jgi:hypothetical protein
MVRILKKYSRGGTVITPSSAKIEIKKIIDDMFLIKYYNMKNIIKYIHKYIENKEKKVLHFTDDDIIEMIKEHKINLATKKWYESDGSLKKNSEDIMHYSYIGTNDERQAFQSNVISYLNPYTGIYTYPNKEKNDSMTEINSIISETLGRLSDNNDQLTNNDKNVEVFLNEIYEIYKNNEPKYNTFFY